MAIFNSYVKLPEGKPNDSNNASSNRYGACTLGNKRDQMCKLESGTVGPNKHTNFGTRNELANKTEAIMGCG